MSSHVDVEKIEPTTFEDQYYDEYEYYNLTDKYTEGSARKGRSKKEASENTNRHNPGGHERKIVEKLQNTEKKAKEQCCNADLVPARRATPSHEQCNPAKE